MNGQIPTRGCGKSLQWLRQAYYDTSRFAHIFVDVKRAPRAVERQIADIRTRMKREMADPNVALRWN